MPRLRLTWRQFCREARRAVETLPEAIRAKLENVSIEVHDWPSEEDLASVADEQGTMEPDELCGLFAPMEYPLRLVGEGDAHPRPHRIKIFRRPLEALS